MKAYRLALLGLTVIHLATFAVFWPFNGAVSDEWSYLYAGQQGQWHGALIDRPFSMGGAVVAAWLFPDTPQGIHWSYSLFMLGTALGLFHLAYRLSGGRVVWAFAYSAVYIVYFPSNVEYSRAFFIQPYAWALLIGVGGAVCLAEALRRESWGWWGAAILSAYITARVYEGFIPMLGMLPMAFWVLGRADIIYGVPTLKWLGAWYTAVAIGSVQFLYGFLGEESGYQSSIQRSKGFDMGKLLEGTGQFLARAFPLKAQVFTTELDLGLVGLLTGGVVLLVGWRLKRDEVVGMPSIRAHGYAPLQAMTPFLIGLLLTILGGAAFIYAGLQTEPRAQYMAGAGAALVITSVLMGIAFLVGRLTQRDPQWILLLLCAALMVKASQWPYNAQRFAVEERGPAYSAKSPFLAQLLGLIPALKDDTLLMYQCREPQTAIQTARLADRYAAQYLYDPAPIQFVAMPFHFTLLKPDEVIFNESGVILTHGYDLIQGGKQTYVYKYDQIVVLGCDGSEGIYIQTDFPDEVMSGALLYEFEHGGRYMWPAYNPYARIVDGFIAISDARMVAR